MTTLVKDTNATRYLSNTGTSNNPAWAQVDLSNGVTGLAQSPLTIATNMSVVAGNSCTLNRLVKVNSGIKLSVASAAILRIL
jgi:hypothetical protein